MLLRENYFFFSMLHKMVICSLGFIHYQRLSHHNPEHQNRHPQTQRNLNPLPWNQHCNILRRQQWKKCVCVCVCFFKWVSVCRLEILNKWIAFNSDDEKEISGLSECVQVSVCMCVCLIERGSEYMYIQLHRKPRSVKCPKEHSKTVNYEDV